jgi:hypothetical protein
MKYLNNFIIPGKKSLYFRTFLINKTRPPPAPFLPGRGALYDKYIEI